MKSPLVHCVLGALVSLAVSLPGRLPAAEVVVNDATGFRRELNQAQPGLTLRLAPGLYGGSYHFANLRGSAEQPILVAAADPANPPVFDGSTGGLQFSGVAHLELRGLVITNFQQNGLNLDDGSSYETPAHHIVLRNLKVVGSSPGGNRDAIKLSGLVDFEVRDCEIEGWGTGGGSGIDMVGCHRGRIEGNQLRHTDSVGSTGIQAKGDTSEIVIRRNRFENAGGRAINIGGSTGLQFFRPPLKPGEEHSEASDITVEGNTFIGSGAPVAFVGVDGAKVCFNTIYHPKRWALRILQETKAPGFVPSRNGEFTDNIVVFDSRDWGEGGVNIGAGTAPETFSFARNWWYCLDNPERSRPRLPTEEKSGVYGKDPELRDPEKGDFTLTPASPARNYGASALK